MRKLAREGKKTQKAANAAKQSLVRKRAAEEAPAPVIAKRHQPASDVAVSKSQSSGTDKQVKSSKPAAKNLDAAPRRPLVKKTKSSVLDIDLTSTSGGSSREQEFEDREIAWLEAQLGVRSRSKKGKGKAAAYGSTFAEDGLEGEFFVGSDIERTILIDWVVDIMMDLDKILMPGESGSESDEDQSEVWFIDVLRLGLV